MDTAVTRKRLEGMLDGLDRSIAVLKGESPAPGDEQAYSFDPADAVQEGTYGQCVDCGKPVPEGRLEARPEASRCVACQAKHDRLRR